MAKISRKRVKEAGGRRRGGRRSAPVLLAALSVAVATCLLFVRVILGLMARPDGGGGSKLRPSPGSSGRKLRPPGAKGWGDGSRRDHRLLPMRKALEDPDWDLDATERAREILSASTQLVELSYGERYSVQDEEYSGIVGHFCPLDFKAQKENPPRLPMFRDVVRHSGCDKEGSAVLVDLKEAVELAAEFDGDNGENSLPSVLDLKGAVFHESRCGSTLAANSMLALDPEKHRVYSESSPPIVALRGCGEDFGECTADAAANLLRDVVYMMARSNDPGEENLFFKFQSVTTRTMEVFREAFPTTPWLFIYREPVEVMMSQLDVERTSDANCVRNTRKSPAVREFLQKTGYKHKNLDNEELCAIHLLTICESALHNLDDAEGLGMAVKYSPDLVHDLLDTVFPTHFHAPVGQVGRDRVMAVSGMYSKNRGRKAEEFVADSEKKEERATREMRGAAKEFLKPSFDRLQQSEHNIRPVEVDDENDGSSGEST